ncbi:hypothetical protein FJZ55_08320 [Candidatus Woesearchaeota archaeon]|nr:hypothetical protein [Candidatus Woesearchaeota archaeon]
MNIKNLSVALVTLIASSVAQAQQAVQWRVQDGGNGHWYEYVPAAMRWNDAKFAADSRNGYLACLTSAAESAFVRGLGVEIAHLGGFQLSGACEPGCGWTWLSGEPWSYSCWAPTQPDNGSNVEHVLELDLSGNWNDYDASAPRNSYIIEWSADCNGDGIVDYGQCRDGSLPDYNGNNIPDCCEAGVPCGSQPGGGESLGFLRLGRLTDTIELSGSAAYGTESTHEFRIRFPAVIQPLDGRLWSEQNGADTDKAIGFGTAYAPNYSVHFGQCCQAPLHVVAAGDLLDGQWHHVAMVRTRTEFRLYVDGVLRASQPSWGQAGSCAGKCPRSIGAFRYSYTGDSLTFPSILADVDWIAISSTARYSGESVVVPCESDIVADDGTRMLFKFNEVGQNTVVSEAGAIVGTFGAGFGGATEPSIVPHCQPLECADADFFRDFNVNGADLGVLLGEWGPANPNTVSDLNHDGVVNGADLGIFLGFWGPCPN